MASRRLRLECSDLGTVLRPDDLQGTRLDADLLAAGASWLPDHECWQVPEAHLEPVRAVGAWWDGLLRRGLSWSPSLGKWQGNGGSGADARMVEAAAAYLNAVSLHSTGEGQGAPTGEPVAEVRRRNPDGPQSLEEYDVGQGRLIRSLRVAIEAAKKRGQPLDHVLLDGPPGLGKTTLANIIANELGTTVLQTSGPALADADPQSVAEMLCRLERGQILFIDEVHRLPAVVEEFLYPAMEVFQIDVAQKDGQGSAETIDLPRFTLIGATTRPGLLSAPLRSRFGIRLHLDFYRPEQLRRILMAYGELLGLRSEAAGLLEVARRSRGTARIAKTLLRRVSDWALVEGDGCVRHDSAGEALSELGVDVAGLDAQDRRYLRTLATVYAGRAAGVRSIASTLNVEVDTLEDVVEPYLLKIGFVIRGPRGRQITHLGREHIGAEEQGRETRSLL